MIKLIYPEERLVSKETILQWAQDAYVNGEIECPPTDFLHAITMLEDAGFITIERTK